MSNISHFVFDLEPCVYKISCICFCGDFFLDKLQWTHLLLFHAKGQQIKWMTICTSNKGLADRQHVANIFSLFVKLGNNFYRVFWTNKYCGNLVQFLFRLNNWWQKLKNLNHNLKKCNILLHVIRVLLSKSFRPTDVGRELVNTLENP